MIAVDTSAIVAILLTEPESEAFQRRMSQEMGCLSAVSLQEASMVIAGRVGDETGWHELDELIRPSAIEIVPHDAALTRIAREAFLRFGKGRHPARLNSGDCASYALAKSRGLKLLFKGGDFARTDIVSALSAAA